MNLEVIIVDDDQIVVFLHDIIIKDCGFHHSPKSFPSGKSALEYLESETDTDKVYCIFLDINMPLFSGWDFLEAIKPKKYADKIFAIMVTSSLDTADKKRAQAYEQIIGFMEKPIEKEELEKLKQNDTLKPFFHTSIL